MSNCLSVIGLSATFIISSLGQLYKYFGIIGVCVYSVAVIAGVSVLRKYAINFFLRKINPRQALFLTLVTFALLLIFFFIVYPVINSNIAGVGSDRDEDLNLATRQLLAGRYPFYVQTYLGNSITHLPGSLFLAAPFVLLGNGAYQNFFWLAIFLIAAARYLQDIRLALLLFWQLMLFSPVFLHELFTGGDLIANGIYVLVFIFFLVNSIETARGCCGWRPFCYAALLGLGLSSRMNFLLLLPLAFSLISQNFGLKPAIKYMSVTCFSFLAVTLPFYLYDPQGFSPFFGQLNKLLQFHTLSPLFVPAVISVVVIVTAALCFRPMHSDCIALFRNSALVQALLVLPVVIVTSGSAGKHALILSGYGLSFLFFGALAFQDRVLQPCARSGLTTLLTNRKTRSLTNRKTRS